MANIPTDHINNARVLIDPAQDILIVLTANHTFDTVAASLSLYLALLKKGKRTSIVCANPMVVEYSHIVGVDKISSNFAVGNGKNLVISFPYQEGSIEKVSYNIENETFNLVIEPREGYPMITPDIVRYSESGGTCDLIITLGATQLMDTGSIYSNNAGFFADKPILNIDTQNNNQQFGKANIVDGTVSSLSELTANILSFIGLSMDTDIASNLYTGIAEGSGNFTSKETTANTFETVAICLRNGARKLSMHEIQTQPFSSLSSIPSMRVSKPQPQPQQPIQVQPKINQPQGGMKQFQQQMKSYPQTQQPPMRKSAPNQPSNAPPDWLKPKIYKGSTLL